MSQRTPPTVPLRPEMTDVAALLRASLAPLMAEAAREGVELRVVTLGEPPEIAVDRDKVAWCVTTLVGNALRYVKRRNDGSEVGGSVIVHVEPDEARGVAIAVHDDGPGIPEEKLPFLFERRQNALHADGLALSLVREIVSAQGGTIRVETRRGREEHGTSITLLLRG